jgi:hypothetical protein
MFNMQATLWRLEASALLEVQERVLPAGAREVRFTQVEGDFKVRSIRSHSNAPEHTCGGMLGVQQRSRRQGWQVGHATRRPRM